MNRFSQQSGFTLLEMFVALVIFSMTLAAFMLVTSRGIYTSRNATQEAIALNLAQEALELVRLKRDYNLITAADPWHEDMYDRCDSSQGCRVDAFRDVDDVDFITQCSSAECGAIVIDSDGFYGDRDHQGSALEGTGFSRRITMEPVESGGFVDKIIIRSEVSWPSGNIDRSVSLEGIITNWR